MIQFKVGDILGEDAEALVNTVNCVGIMGRGVALQFKKAFPENFAAYATACKRGEVQPGRMFVFERRLLDNPRYIINFPTKQHWRRNSRIEYIDAGLDALSEEIRVRGIRSIALPPLGSGLGGLDWHVVRQRIVDALSSFDNLDIVVFEPAGAPAANVMVRSWTVPKMTAGRAALIMLMDRYLRGLLDPFVTLLEVHKLVYFLQEAGEPLKLRFTKAPYGPFAENLGRVLNAVEGHFILGYADGGDRPGKPLEVMPGAVENAETVLAGAIATRQRFERVADLVEGFESGFGLELLSTVHWVLKRESGEAPNDVVARTHRWNPRKERFSPQQIKRAVGVLTDKGWTNHAEAANCG